jgi:hypothetical protein
MPLTNERSRGFTSGYRSDNEEPQMLPAQQFCFLNRTKSPIRSKGLNPLCAITLAIGIAGLVFANAQTNAGLNWFATVTSLLSQGTGDRQPLVPADAIGDYRSAASGNWNAITTWESFNGTSWIPAVATPTSADGIVTIRSGHTVTISASGLSYDQVVVDAGGQVTVAATITHTLANGVGTDLIVNGTWLNQGGIWTVTGATWAVVAGGSFVHNTTAGIATPLGVVTLDPASTFIYRGSSTLTPSSAVSGRT